MSNSTSFQIRSQELNTPIPNATAEIHSVSGESNFINANENGYIQFDPSITIALLIRCDGYTSRKVTNFSSKRIRLLPNSAIGYQDRISYRSGDKVEVYIHSPSSFRLTLVRHGFKKEKILKFEQQGPILQEADDSFDVVESGLNWKKSFTYEIPKDLASGLYSLCIEPTNPELNDHSIPMTIAEPIENKAVRSKLLVLASNTTWQSYNIWGGRSRYRNNQGDNPVNFIVSHSPFVKMVQIVGKFIPLYLKRFIVNLRRLKENDDPWKFKKLSIRRPFTNCGLEEKTPCRPFMNHLASGEWRVIAWLEREKIPFEYASCTDLERDSKLLENYKAVILSTHCEYWSKNMYDSLDKANQKGLWILNMSGNSIYREIEFFDDDSTRCVSLSFQRSHTDETELIGVRFDNLDYATAAPYRATSLQHWAFERCMLDVKNPIFGTHSLNQNVQLDHRRKYDPGRVGRSSGLIGSGASGWECDKRTSNSKKDFHLLAKGTNPKGGAEMVIREANSKRGAAFSASSVTFGGSLLIDYNCSQIVKNVILKSLR